MKPALTACAALFALGGATPALIAGAVLAAAYVARSPDRLLDAGYIAVLCGLGYLVG